MSIERMQEDELERLREAKLQAEIEDMREELAAGKRARKAAKVVRAAKLIGMLLFVGGFIVGMFGETPDPDTGGTMSATGLAIWVVAFIVGLFF
jgi:hypothetical protein